MNKKILFFIWLFFFSGGIIQALTVHNHTSHKVVLTVVEPLPFTWVREAMRESYPRGYFFVKLKKFRNPFEMASKLEKWIGPDTKGVESKFGQDILLLPGGETFLETCYYGTFGIAIFERNKNLYCMAETTLYPLVLFPDDYVYICDAMEKNSIGSYVSFQVAGRPSPSYLPAR